jgi:septin family protein
MTVIIAVEFGLTVVCFSCEVLIAEDCLSRYCPDYKPPLAIVCAKCDTGGREYPWGKVDVSNPVHSDLSCLREMLVRTEAYRLREQTKQRYDEWYEQYDTYRAKKKAAEDAAAKAEAARTAEAQAAAAAAADQAQRLKEAEVAARTAQEAARTAESEVERLRCTVSQVKHELEAAVQEKESVEEAARATQAGFEASINRLVEDGANHRHAAERSQAQYATLVTQAQNANQARISGAIIFHCLSKLAVLIILVRQKL